MCVCVCVNYSMNQLYINHSLNNSHLQSPLSLAYSVPFISVFSPIHSCLQSHSVFSPIHSGLQSHSFFNQSHSLPSSVSFTPVFSPIRSSVPFTPVFSPIRSSFSFIPVSCSFRSRVPFIFYFLAQSRRIRTPPPFPYFSHVFIYLELIASLVKSFAMFYLDRYPQVLIIILKKVYIKKL